MSGVYSATDIIVPTGNHEGKDIIIFSDHRGYEFKREIVRWLRRLQYNVINIITPSAKRCDYPKVSINAAKEMQENPNAAVIGICGSGYGAYIPISKQPRIIAERCINEEQARLSRLLLNANVLTLGADPDYIGNVDVAKNIITTWLETPFGVSEDAELYIKNYGRIRSLEEEILDFYHGKLRKLKKKDVIASNHIGKKVYIGFDALALHLEGRVSALLDRMGCSSYCVNNLLSDYDYLDVSFEVGKMVAEDPQNRFGIIITSEQVGTTLLPSKFPGVIAVTCSKEEEAVTSRKHNNSDVLGISLHYVGENNIGKILKPWLLTEFFSDPEQDKNYRNRYLQTRNFECEIFNR